MAFQISSAVAPRSFAFLVETVALNLLSFAEKSTATSVAGWALKTLNWFATVTCYVLQCNVSTPIWQQLTNKCLVRWLFYLSFLTSYTGHLSLALVVNRFVSMPSQLNVIQGRFSNNSTWPNPKWYRGSYPRGLSKPLCLTFASPLQTILRLLQTQLVSRHFPAKVR